MTWQPISTAPRDGRVILLAKERDVVAGWWSNAPETRTRWGTYSWVMVEDQPEFDDDGSQAAGHGVIRPNGWKADAEGPTHWMDLPPPPTPTSDTAAFLARMRAAAETGERVTADDVALLRKLADWADSPPAPGWNGTLDRGEAMRAIEAAERRMRDE